MDEFNRIATFLAPLSRGYDGAHGLLDDVALLEAGSLVVNTDTIVERVHYMGDEPANIIAKKLLRTNLSDLAAKGATPLYYTLNLTLGLAQSDAWFAAFAKGLAEDQETFGLTLIGGDTTISHGGPCVLSATMFGRPTQGANLPRRSGAKPGDGVYVSGTIGDGAAGLKVARGELAPTNTHDGAYLLQRYQLPQPRLELGLALAPLMSASLDISDGLMQDAKHIATCSNARIDIAAQKIPLSPPLKHLIDNHRISLEEITCGGDDYEICFTIHPENEARAIAASAHLAPAITKIGEVCHGQGVRLIDQNGAPIALKTLGFTHGNSL